MNYLISLNTLNNWKRKINKKSSLKFLTFNQYSRSFKQNMRKLINRHLLGRKNMNQFLLSLNNISKKNDICNFITSYINFWRRSFILYCIFLFQTNFKLFCRLRFYWLGKKLFIKRINLWIYLTFHLLKGWYPIIWL